MKEVILGVPLNEHDNGYTIKCIPSENDPVNHPSHYTTGKIECADYIIDKELDFLLGNVVKYITRAGRKDASKTIEDLKKAQWYLNKKIEVLENVQL